MKPTHPVNTKGKAVFELKHRVSLSLNKLADRDTYQLASHELERIAESLSAEMIPPFLSCVTDMDSDAKSSVRKESIRLMGILGNLHGPLLGPHTSKIISSIVKRLKDSDSVVRDCCVETCGVIARNVRGVFVNLARALFEALGEQNRFIQAGGALCLARVIDETEDFPAEILPQMLMRVVKLLKNPHFMAKPAVIELIRSIIQAGGATTENSLSTALTNILDALKNTDWNTRRSASVALASISVSCGYLLGSFKSNCLRSLESCRFDKVKPVRDSVIHAIQCWKCLPGSNSTEPSETGSTTKENCFRDYSDFASVSDSGSRATSFRKSVSVFVSIPNENGNRNNSSSRNKRTPLSIKKPTTNTNIPTVKPKDWQIEISLPKKKNNQLDSPFDTKRRGEEEDSDVASRSCVTKDITLDDCDSLNLNSKRINGKFSNEEEVESMCVINPDQKSLDCSCVNSKNELGLIRKQLEEIQVKQSNLFNLLQEYMSNSMDNLSILQTKVHNMENSIEKIGQFMTQNETNFRNMPISQFTKNGNGNSVSVSLSSTPRSSLDTTIPNNARPVKSKIGLTDFSRRVNGFLNTGDFESAYITVLNKGDETSIIGLMDFTGPVLDRLSCETANEVIRVLGSLFTEQKFLDSALPWLHQVVELCADNEARQIFISTRAEKEFLSAVQEVVMVGSIDPTVRICIAQLAAKLGKAFGMVQYRKSPPQRIRGMMNFSTNAI